MWSQCFTSNLRIDPFIAYRHSKYIECFLNVLCINSPDFTKFIRNYLRCSLWYNSSMLLLLSRNCILLDSITALTNVVLGSNINWFLQLDKKRPQLIWLSWGTCWCKRSVRSLWCKKPEHSKVSFLQDQAAERPRVRTLFSNPRWSSSWLPASITSHMSK